MQLTHKIDPAAGLIALRFVESLATKPNQGIEILDLKAIVDGQPMDLNTDALYERAPLAPQWPWVLSGEGASISVKIRAN